LSTEASTLRPTTGIIKPRFSIRKNGDGSLVPRHHSGIDPGLVGEKAFKHPAVTKWWGWLLSEYEPPYSVALITPCSNVKPYTKSPTSRKIRGLLRRLDLWDSENNRPRGIVWLYFSDLLIFVPYERAEEYPACCYEVPPQLVLANPGLVELVTSKLSEAVKHLADYLEQFVVFLPRRHLALWEAAKKKSAKWPAELRVKYTLFSTSGVEAALKTVLEDR
jgi:hypothetical protein